MGLNIQLTNESGEKLDEVADYRDLLGAVLPSWDDKSSHYLRFLDPYGDTSFNWLQMEGFIPELQGLIARVSDPETLELLRKIEVLARRCQDEQEHLKFVGD